jgi:hypothetical protein
MFLYFSWSNRFLSLQKLIIKQNISFCVDFFTTKIGKGNDQIRFELSSYALNPKIKVRQIDNLKINFFLISHFSQILGNRSMAFT